MYSVLPLSNDKSCELSLDHFEEEEKNKTEILIK